MAFVHQVTLDLKDKPSCLGLISLRVTTDRTPEVPEVWFLALEFLQSGGQEI